MAVAGLNGVDGMRKEQRKSVGRSARIELDDKRRLHCLIANISTGGALLLVRDSEYLPKTFLLIDVFTEMSRRVAIVWTGSHRAGVRFLDTSPNLDHLEFGRRRA